MHLRALGNSYGVLIGATAVTLGAMVVAIFPLASYVSLGSSSLSHNFYAIGGFMGLLLGASAIQGFLAVRLLWGPGANGEIPGQSQDEGGEDDAVAAMRGMRATGTKKAVVFFVLIVLNTLIFDAVGGGVLVSDTRVHRVLTLLRSEDGQDRADATHDAILFTGDERITAALGRVIDRPGAAREWALYAAGARHDTTLAASIVNLIKTGSPRERAAAATALARLGDERLIPLIPLAYPHAGELRGDLIKALGMLGKGSQTSPEDVALAGEFLAGLLNEGQLDKELTRLTIWALGRFDAPQGLEPIERLLHSSSDSGTLCTGLEALGRIGSADTSPKLIESIYKLDKTVSCPELVYRDFAGDEVLICSSVNLIERLLHEIAHIGDRRAKPEMEKLAKDETFSKQVRAMAGEIAFQMKYKAE